MAQPPRTRQRIRRGEQLWLVAGSGTARTDRVAEIAPRLRTHQVLSYAIPAELLAAVRPGVRVAAPYGAGGRAIEGWVLEVSEQPWEHTRKSLTAVLDAETILDGALIQLGRWVASYYHCPLGLVLDTMVPARLRSAPTGKTRVVRLLDGAATPLNARQQRVVDLLAAHAAGGLTLRAVLARAECSRATVRTLERRGVLAVDVVAARIGGWPDAAAESAAKSAEEVASSAAEAVADATEGAAGARGAAQPEDGYALTAGQAAALERLGGAARAREFGVYLLFGVPGSGKTEVYVRAIRGVIAAGRQALLLVPEIALATQIVERLARRFGRVAVLHSRLTDKARGDALRRIAAGAVDVVIGTRTAVFAPLRRLGLIVVDEEQESSFKSIAAPFYHTRDVAIKRGHLEQTPVVLGSATPSLESWHNAGRLRHYHRLDLPQRVPGAELPDVRLIDTSRRGLGQTSVLLSPELIGRLRTALAAGQQAILLHNRRGYAVFLRCERCGLVVRCQRCGTHMIFHRTGNELKCHRCGRRAAAPESCSDDSCGGPLERFGLGIQRLEDELREHLPAARLLRLDRDTMRRRTDYAAALTAFEQRAADILIGTQMVAKGLDFPGVQLVGVLDADAGLALPDFRAFERTFQLLVQVVGRAGRRAGESTALLQTAQPELSLWQAAMRCDYPAFAASELEVRRAGHDPPFTRLTRILCLDPRGASARAAAERIAAGLQAIAEKLDARIRVDPPQPAPIPRLRELHRWQVLVRTPPEAPGGARLLAEAERQRLLRPGIARITIDVDVIDTM